MILEIYYEKNKVARESFIFINNLENNLQFDPNILKYFAHNCKYLFKDVDIELLHSVLTRTISNTHISNDTISDAVLKMGTYHELKNNFIDKQNQNYKTHQQQQREEPGKRKHVGKRIKVLQLFLSFARAGLLDKIPNCRDDVDVIEKTKAGKIIKETPTNDGKLTGLKHQLDKFDQYDKKLQDKRNREIEEAKDGEINDCVSGKKNKNQLEEVVAMLINRIKTIYQGNDIVKKIFKRKSFFRISTYKKFIRARLPVIEKIEKDKPNINVFNKFLKLVDNKWKDNPDGKIRLEWNMDKATMVDLYKQAVRESQ